MITTVNLSTFAEVFLAGVVFGAVVELAVYIIYRILHRKKKKES